MNLLNWAYVVVATVCATVAVQHLMVAARLRERRIYILFAMTALAAAVEARGPFSSTDGSHQASWLAGRPPPCHPKQGG